MGEGQQQTCGRLVCRQDLAATEAQIAAAREAVEQAERRLAHTTAMAESRGKAARDMFDSLNDFRVIQDQFQDLVGIGTVAVSGGGAGVAAWIVGLANTAARPGDPSMSLLSKTGRKGASVWLGAINKGGGQGAAAAGMGKLGLKGYSWLSSVGNLFEDPALLGGFTDYFYGNASSDDILALRQALFGDEHLLENASGWDRDKVLEDWQNAAADREQAEEELERSRSTLEAYENSLETLNSMYVDALFRSKEEREAYASKRLEEIHEEFKAQGGATGDWHSYLRENHTEFLREYIPHWLGGG